MNYLNNPNVPRGIRNNNPGNIVRTSAGWQGKIPFAQSQDNHFEQFTEMKYGVRALLKDIYNAIKGGKNTAEVLISAYAPDFENNTTAYIATVSSLIGIGITDLLDLSQETIVGIAKAIVYVENGSNGSHYVTEADYTNALAILGIPLKKKVK